MACPELIEVVSLSAVLKLRWLILVMAGFALRSWDLSSQILLDDEWHSLGLIHAEDWKSLMTTYFPRATSIPLNVYQRWVSDVFGLSEWSLRFPSILASLGFLLLFARVSRSSAAVACLAFSPFLIFYSMSSRPYALYLLFAFAAVIDGPGLLRPRWRAVWAALAGWFHPLALPGMALSLLWKPGAPFLIFSVLTGCLFGLPVLKGVREALPGGMAADLPGWSDGWEIMKRGFGSQIQMFAGIFLVLTGLVAAIRRRRAELVPLFLAIFGTLIACFWAQPEELNAPIVFLRYNILLFPAVALCVALVLEGFSFRKYLTIAIVAVCLWGWMDSPFGNAFWSGSSFRLHWVFMRSADPLDWNRIELGKFYHNMDKVLTPDSVPPFYRSEPWLRSRGAVLEAPFLVGDPLNAYFYYQHFHRRPVVVGYSEGGITGRILGRIPPGKFRFHTLKNLDALSLENLRGIDWIVVHKDPFAELVGGHPEKPWAESARLRQSIEEQLRKRQEYEDEKVWAFRLGSS
jgi:hypothetical protein